MPTPSLLERETPMAALLALIDDVATGAGACVLIGGEAGIGKSSLVDALAAQVATRVDVLVGACDAMHVPRPLGPLADIAADLDPVVASHLERRSSQADVFNAVRAALAARKRPALLIVEDAHWADEATRDLIRFLARRIARLPVLLVVTYRADERSRSDPLRLLLGDLVGARIVRIDLEPLSAAAVRQLVRTATRARPYASHSGALEADDAVHALTGGNPFFVREILAEPTGRLPPTVRDVIVARLLRMPPDVQTLLRIVSLVPSRCERDVLAHAFPEAYAAASSPGFDEATAGLLAVSESALAFRHELGRRAIAEAVADAMPDVAQAWHLRFLDTLERLPGKSPARLAHHASASRVPALIARWALPAGIEAARVGANREAAQLFAAAIAARAPDDPHDRVDLLEQHADACQAILELGAAIASRRTAVAACEARGDSLRAGDNLRKLGRLHWLDGDRARAMTAYVDALTLLEPLGATRELAWAYAFRAGAHMTAEEDGEAIDYATRGLVLADELGALDVRVHALNTLGDSQQYRARDWREKLEESLRLSLEQGFVEHAARAYINLSSTTVVAQDFPYARTALDDGIRYAIEHDLDYQRDYLRAWKARERFECDDWVAAETLARALIAHPRTAPVARIPAAGTLAAVAVRRGDADATRLLDAAEEESARTGEHQRLAPLVDARAEAAWLAGDDATCAGHARAGAAAALAHGSLDNLGRFAIWLWRSGQQAEARVLLEREPRCPSRFANEIRGRWREAADDWRARGCAYQQALAECGGPPAAIRQALALLDRLGAAQAVRAVRSRHALRGALPGPRSSTRRDPLGLTPSERRVLEFLALGWSNAAIAAKLFRSERTIEHHVSQLLSKLGVDSRTKAVALLERAAAPAAPSI